MAFTNGTAPTMGSHSPWGAIDLITDCGKTDGRIMFVSTPGHGGFWVCNELAALLKTRLEGWGFTPTSYHRFNWFEEDCEAWLVTLGLSDELNGVTLALTDLNLGRWRNVNGLAPLAGMLASSVVGSVDCAQALIKFGTAQPITAGGPS